MIFSRKNIKPLNPRVTGNKFLADESENDVMDIARTMVPPTSAPKAVIPQSPMRQAAGAGTSPMPKAMAFTNSDLTQIDTSKGAAAQRNMEGARKEDAIRGATAIQDQKRAAIDAAKRKAQETMATTGAANSREITDGIDYNRDGVIGDPSTQAGRQMTQEDLINTAINEFLRPVDNTGARSAADEAIQQRNAENRANARARLGVAGMGLTGAAAAAEGTEGRRGERERVLTMDEFDRNARQEQAERYLTGMGQSRESEVFKRVMAELDKENGAELPNLDANGDGDISDVEQANYDRAIQNRNRVQDAESTSEIMGMSQEEFEAMTPGRMAAAGWSVQKDSRGNPQVRKDSGGDYYTWVGPNGETKKAYVDDGGENFAWSMGLEWV
jgi:hypothetical protein